MEIRQATDLDIPGIVDLLRSSLGESVLPKSEKIWRYKHFENPFGKSLVLIAVMDGKIVGVRAFMRWEWNWKGEQFNAFRSVDTGTLPLHQGKGIFRALNMKAVEIAKKEGGHFIFNTPNSKSLPGNLKMGWKKMGKIRVGVFPSNLPIGRIRKELRPYTIHNEATDVELGELCFTYNEHQDKREELFTPKSVSYLRWRYEVNPLQQYEVIADKDFYLSVHVKTHKYFKELRVTEHIYVDPIGLGKIKKSIDQLRKKFGATVITFSPKLNYSLFKISGSFGPLITFRDLNLDETRELQLLQFKKWNYSLGDLELF